MLDHERNYDLRAAAQMGADRDRKEGVGAMIGGTVADASQSVGDRQLSSLHKELALLQAEVNRLRQQLTPVLCPPVPVAENGTVACSATADIGRVANSIEVAADLAAQIRATVADIDQRFVF